MAEIFSEASCTQRNFEGKSFHPIFTVQCPEEQNTEWLDSEVLKTNIKDNYLCVISEGVYIADDTKKKYTSLFPKLLQLEIYKKMCLSKVVVFSIESSSWDICISHQRVWISFPALATDSSFLFYWPWEVTGMPHSPCHPNEKPWWNSRLLALSVALHAWCWCWMVGD